MTGFKRNILRRLTALVIIVVAPLVCVLASDSDGDGLPDAEDAHPLLADFPLYWQMEALLFQWFPPPEESTVAGSGDGWSEAESLTLYSGMESRVPLLAANGASSSFALTLVAKESEKMVDYAQFGLGAPASWGALQQLRAQSLAANPRRAGRSARLQFALSFVNRGAKTVVINHFRVPLLVGERTHGWARPFDNVAHENGFALPADGKPRLIRFLAEITADGVEPLLADLRRAAPMLAFEAAEGELTEGDEAQKSDLLERLRSIHQQTVQLSVLGDDGSLWSWRVARKMAGKAQKVGDWSAAVNALCQADFYRAQNGFLTSLNGWDTGAWNRWWHLDDGSSGALGGTDWSALALDRDLKFVLRDDPPPLGRREMARIKKIADTPPIITCWQGRSEWLRGNFGAAVAAYRRAAAAAYAPAQNWLGHCQYEGKGIEADKAAAAALFKEAANQGYVPSAAWLGRCYLRGEGVARSQPTGVAWLAKAASQGFLEGMALYALSLQRGAGVKQDEALGARLLRSAAGRDGSLAQMILGSELLDSGFAEGLDWLRCAAAQGNIKAQRRVAQTLWEGADGVVARNRAAAVPYFATAAREGDASAQLGLARALLNGVGVASNEAEALKWFTKAAEQGNAEAQCWLGMMLIDGRGARRNATTGTAWVHKAAANDFALAQHLMGLCLRDGIGVPKSESEAFEWFKRAAAQGVAAAQVFAGFYYYEGSVTPQNLTEAVACFRQAAEQGSIAGQCWLAFCYGQGAGVERDLEEARKLAKQVAAQNSAAGAELLRQIERKE